MKISPTKSVIWIAGLALVMMVVFFTIRGYISILGVAFIFSLTGLIYGLVIRERKIWKPFLLALIIILLFTAGMIFLVSISDM